MTVSSPLERSTIADIMRRWQTAAAANWKHIDPPLLASGGLVWQAMQSVLTVLSHAKPGEVVAPDSFNDEEEEDQEDQEDQIYKEYKEYKKNKTKNERALMLARTTFDTHAGDLQLRAERLTALPVAWPDQRKLLHLLAVAIRQTLTDQATASNTAGSPEAPQLPPTLAHSLTYYEGAIEALTVRIGDLCISQLQQQIDDHHEQSLATEHLAERFLGNASHELRTPMTAIMGFADLLIEGTYGPLNPEQIVHIGHIENSAANLNEIISNMLDLLHIRAGKRTLNYRPVDVAAMLHTLHQILTPLAERKKVQFQLDLPEELGTIEMDEGIVRHIVYHLLSSALRATPAGGVVVLRAQRQSPWLVIEAQDTALHLPPDAVANMLDPFPRLENSPTRGYEGWEVGLPLVRRYVELHHGQLHLESLPEKGTIFYVTLPLKRQ